MTEKLVLAAVLLCVFTENVSMISSQPCDSRLPKVQVVDTSIDITNQENAGVTQKGVNRLNGLLGKTVKEPSLVVEVNNATNDASLKIIHLPIVRHTRNSNVLISDTKVFNSTTTASYIAKNRSKRDIDFEIHDKSVIKALIQALKLIDHQRADLMEANIDRVEINIEISDQDEWNDDRKRRSISNANNHPNYSTIPKSRRVRDVDFKIYDRSVITAMITAIQRVDHAKADFMQKNIDLVVVTVDIEDHDNWIYRIFENFLSVFT